MKNCAGQLISPLRTITFGRFSADSSAARRMCMPPSAFVRDDRQSDHLVALMFNPYFLITDPDTSSVHYINGFYLMFFMFFLRCVFPGLTFHALKLKIDKRMYVMLNGGP